MKILSICGSPRKGNSEAILSYVQTLFEEKGVQNDVILLREKNINQCKGCVEYCNRTLTCQIKDDMPDIMNAIEKSDGYIFAVPNYFKMPPGLFKIFMDRMSIFYTSGRHEDVFGGKKAVVICVGADEPKETDVCRKIIEDNFCKTMSMDVADGKSFKTNSELKGNNNDVFKNGYNKTIKEDLEKVVATFSENG